LSYTPKADNNRNILFLQRFVNCIARKGWNCFITEK